MSAVRKKPYPNDRASGIEWLATIPEHWDVKRLKTAATYWVSNVDKVPSDGELPVILCNYTDVYYNDEIRADMGLMETTATRDEIRKFGLREGDVVITKDSEEWSDIAVPALVTEAAPDLVCGYHLAIVRPNHKVALGRYLFRAFQATAVNQQFQTAATGVTRYGLPKASIGEAWIPLPPIDEQRSIADFLGRATGKIDALIERNRQLTKRLKDKRTSIISHTINRGLPPNIAKAHGVGSFQKLIRTNVDWIPEIPSHWEIRRLRHISDVITVGVVVKAVVPPSLEGANCASIMIVRGHRRFCSQWLAYAFNSKVGRDQIEIVQYGAAQKQFNISHAVDFSFPFPPLHEQEAIADFLDYEIGKLEQLMAKVEEAIRRLREYRAALITAAVTGKIDVRGNVADNRCEPARVD